MWSVANWDWSRYFAVYIDGKENIYAYGEGNVSGLFYWGFEPVVNCPLATAAGDSLTLGFLRASFTQGRFFLPRPLITPRTATQPPSPSTPFAPTYSSRKYATKVQKTRPRGRSHGFYFLARCDSSRAVPKDRRLTPTPCQIIGTHAISS